LAAKLSVKHLVVLLESMFCIYSLNQKPEKLYNINGLAPNPRGICALGVEDNNNILAYPGSADIGEVQLFDVAQRTAQVAISAHSSPVAALALNRSASKLATASVKGTVIRVFSVVDGQKLFEFRRGVKRYASIYSLSFSPNSSFLAASSNTETVHLFKMDQKAGERMLESPLGENHVSASTWLEYFEKAGLDCFNKVVSSSSAYLPTQMNELFAMERAFATAKLPFTDLKNICSLTVVEQKLRLFVVSAEGVLYVYDIDPTQGGDCTLVKNYRIDKIPAKTSNRFLHCQTTTYAQAIQNKGPQENTNEIRNASSAETQSSDARVELPTVLFNTSESDVFIPEYPQKLRLDDHGEFPPIATD